MRRRWFSSERFDLIVWFDAARVAAPFAAENAHVAREISELVVSRIAAFGARG